MTLAFVISFGCFIQNKSTLSNRKPVLGVNKLIDGMARNDDDKLM